MVSGDGQDEGTCEAQPASAELSVAIGCTCHTTAALDSEAGPELGSGWMRNHLRVSNMDQGVAFE